MEAPSAEQACGQLVNLDSFDLDSFDLDSFDYPAFKRGWLAACAARGIDPIQGPTPSQAEAVQRERRRRSKRPFDFLFARMAEPTAADYARPTPHPEADAYAGEIDSQIDSQIDDLTGDAYLIEIDPADLDPADRVAGIRYYEPRPTERSAERMAERRAAGRGTHASEPARLDEREIIAGALREVLRELHGEAFERLCFRFLLGVMHDVVQELRREDVARDRPLKELHHAHGVRVEWIALTPTLTTSVLVPV